MDKRKKSKEIKIIVEYEDNTDKKDVKSFQETMQNLFNYYIKNIMQNKNNGG